MKDDNLFVVRNKMYSDIGDYLNNVRFQIRISTYALETPTAIKENNFVPLFITNIDKNEKTNTIATISDMINYANKSISFNILKNNDVLKIYKILIVYIENLNAVKKLSDDGKKYLKKANKLKTLLERALEILSRLDQNIKREYKDKKSIDNIIQDYE